MVAQPLPKPIEPSLIRSWTNALSRFNVALGSGSGISTMFLMLILVPDVMARKFLGFTIPFASELAVTLLMGKIFLGLPGAQASQAHFNVMILTGHLPPKVKRVVHIFALTMSLVLIALLAWYTSSEAITATRRAEAVFVGSREYSIWPQRIIVAIGFVFLAAQLSADLLRALLGLPACEIQREGSGWNPE